MDHCARCAAVGKTAAATRTARDFQGVERTVCEDCGSAVDEARQRIDAERYRSEALDWLRRRLLDTLRVRMEEAWLDAAYPARHRTDDPCLLPPPPAPPGITHGRMSLHIGSAEIPARNLRME